MVKPRSATLASASSAHSPPRRGARSGSVAVEYAIVLPLLLLMVFGLVDSGRIFWTYTTLSRSVAAAARCAAINTVTCGTAENVRSYAASQAWGLGLTSSAYTVSVESCGMQVEGTMVFQFLMPWFFGTAPYGSANAITLTTTACYPT